MCTGWNWQLERVSASEDGWVERGKGKGKEIEIGLAGPVLKWQRDMEVRYPASSTASEEEDEEHFTCVSIGWNTKSVNAAYENLLR